MIPPFRDDGYMPEGIHSCTEAEAVFRFGGGSRRRRRLVVRLCRWLALANAIEARRLLLDGSFVTAKKDPQDIDAVLFLPPDFVRRLEGGDEAALELEDMLLTRQPEELFAAEDEADWLMWVDFFSQTRELDGRRKGLAEVLL